MDNKSCYALCDQSGRSEMDYDDELVSDEEMEKIETEVARRREFHKRYGEDAFYFYDVMVLLHSEIDCRPGELSALRVRDVKEEDLHNIFHRVGIRGKTSYAFRRTVNSRLEEAGFTPSELAYLLGHTPDTNVKHYTNPRKNATLAKFRSTFCVRSTFGLPENVIEFKSKKPKNREFSGFSKTTISAGSRT